jgi:hypothetical protein
MGRRLESCKTDGCVVGVETYGRYCESYNTVGCVAMKLWDEGENPARQMALLWVSKLMVAIANRTIQLAVLRRSYGSKVRNRQESGQSCYRANGQRR